MKKLKFVIVFGLSIVLDHYQIIRHKMSYIFSIFECSENGHFLDTLLFLLKFLKSITFIVHKPVIYSMFTYTCLSKL
ncbi:hypothetical protein F4V48_12195 [Lactococcus lactis subsp. hordniae]|uniref:Uncharacterized protein n=1 Tax=Lactococcus lactis subsp. hordniae TaxID=203404 RepID=A0A5M9PS91_LACLH|nr:hypothetical protein F4V48_12195 [Lactococcus lactis subsp. hordniae]MCT3135573.1 hypothetical protein [Lactococcus lactis]